jgi:hypothetical protein
MNAATFADAPATATVDRLRDAIDRHRFPDLAAKAALLGWSVWRTDAEDGPQRFFAARWGRVTPPMASMDEVEALLNRLGGKGA